VKPVTRQIHIGMQLLKFVKNVIIQGPFGMKPLSLVSLVQLHFLSGMRPKKHVRYVLFQPQYGTTRLKNVSLALTTNLCGIAP
jgi:hypothetical protein